MLATTQWPLERAVHLTSHVWVCVLWLPESLMDLSALCSAVNVRAMVFERYIYPASRSAALRRLYGIPRSILWKKCLHIPYHKIQPDVAFKSKKARLSFYHLIYVHIYTIIPNDLDKIYPSLYITYKCMRRLRFCTIAYTDQIVTGVITKRNDSIKKGRNIYYLPQC